MVGFVEICPYITAEINGAEQQLYVYELSVPREDTEK
jgi:hypothetical protein